MSITIKSNKSASFGLDSIKQIPHSHYFSIKLANEIEKSRIVNIMQNLKRQTMNLRAMPKAQLILLHDNNKKVIGWAGVDYLTNPHMPEMFSLFVMPDYRSYRLSIILTHARCLLLRKNGIKKAFIRMEAESNLERINYNINSRMYRLLKTYEIDHSWKSYCRQCELYKNTCQQQAYLEVDITKLLNYCANKVGTIKDLNFSQSIVLLPQKNNSSKHTAQWYVQ